MYARKKRLLEAVDEDECLLLQLLDEEYTRHPFYGSRRMTKYLCGLGHRINRKRVQRLMQTLGLAGMAPGPNTSKPHPQHKIYPYLLRNVVIDRKDQVWATDITYIPLARGFMYLVAIMDWWSRYVLAWKTSTTLDTAFCLEALEKALAFGKPEIFNSDQGSQFTSNAFTNAVKDNGIDISMDGRGRCMDNIFTERLWRSLKYENVYLMQYETFPDGRQGIDSYFDLYNNVRLHQALRYRTPAEVYFQRAD